MKDTESDAGLHGLAFLKEGVPRGFSEQLREQKVIDLVPGVPVYELLEDACNFCGKFFLQHVRTRNGFGFHAPSADPIDISEFSRTINAYEERLRIFIDENSRHHAPGITSYQALNILQSYTSWLKAFESGMQISSSNYEAFFRSIIQLRAELFEVGYKYEMSTIQGTIQREVETYYGRENPHLIRESVSLPATTLVARTKRRSEQLEEDGSLRLIQSTLTDAIGEMSSVLDEVAQFEDPGIGFHVNDLGGEIRSDVLCEVLLSAGSVLTDQFRALDQRTGADLVLRLHLQNALTITDALLVHLMLNGHEHEISASALPDMSRYLQSARYALQEIVDAARAYTDDSFST